MFRLLSGILLLLVAPLATLAPAAAQVAGTTVYVRSVAPDGTAITDACYTFINAGLEGCDENRDGYIRFEGIPAGSYTVQQTQPVAGYLPVGDFPVTLEPSTTEQYVDVLMAPATAPTGATVDIVIRAVDPANGESFAGACVILHGGSNEGCDENGDGQITFQDVATGTYLLEETSTPDGAYTFGSQWVTVDRDGEVLVLRPMSGAHPGGGTADVSLATRDPNTGNLLPGACYIILNASIEGCDENRDGQIDFLDVAVGTHPIEFTCLPTGYSPAYTTNSVFNDPDNPFPVTVVYIGLMPER